MNVLVYIEITSLNLILSNNLLAYNNTVHI